jgi:hypothetical protein
MIEFATVNGNRRSVCRQLDGKLELADVCDHNLNIPRYVEPKSEQVVLTVEEATKRLQKSATTAFAAEDRLVAILKREGLLS